VTLPVGLAAFAARATLDPPYDLDECLEIGVVGLLCYSFLAKHEPERPMPISVTCSHCGKRLKARDELAGKALPCPSCKERVLIPEAEEDIAGYLLQEEPSRKHSVNPSS
jgi:DNA-directed RNA polymerase subunit RPC12/RpoP